MSLVVDSKKNTDTKQNAETNGQPQQPPQRQKLFALFMFMFFKPDKRQSEILLKNDFISDDINA